MDREALQKRIDSFEERCREDGAKATVQRRAVLQVVLESVQHPTADQVYETVAARMPGMSRATVYRALDTLATMRLIRRVCHPGQSVRYDRNVDTHHHLVCERCDTIIDIFDSDLDSLALPDVAATGFEISDFNVQFRGICRSCRAKEDQS